MPHSTASLVEPFLSETDPNPAPDDLDIITESTECDSWAAEVTIVRPTPGVPANGFAPDSATGPEDLDTITRSDGERDAWASVGPEDLDTITHSGPEADSWALSSDPTPRPDDDLDTITFTDNERDCW